MSTRTRDENGFIAVQAMGIVVILLGTMLLIVGAAASSRNAARESREFTEASRAVDQAQSQLLYDWNTGVSTPFAAGESGGGTLAATSTFTTWYTTDVEAQTVTFNATANTNGVAEDTEENATFPVRSRLVSSSQDSGDGNAAGIPAGPRQAGIEGPDTLGAWGAAVATGNDAVSTVYGTVNGQWDAYGGSIDEAGGANLVSYSDQVAPPSNAGINAYAEPGTFDRSSLNAYLDKTQLDDLMANAETCPGSQALTVANLNAAASGSYLCSDASTILGTVNRSATGVVTAVVKGNLRITGSISTGLSGELHLYVDGDVLFHGPGVHRILNRVYIYAPRGTCYNAPYNPDAPAAAASVSLTGSLACGRVVLNEATAGSSSVTWQRPRYQPAGAPYTSNVEAPTPVYFLEKTGFVDSLPRP